MKGDSEMTVKELVESAKDNPVSFICDACEGVIQGGYKSYADKKLFNNCYSELYARLTNLIDEAEEQISDAQKFL